MVMFLFYFRCIMHIHARLYWISIKQKKQVTHNDSQQPWIKKMTRVYISAGALSGQNVFCHVH